jgi:hypothetical protein
MDPSLPAGVQDVSLTLHAAPPTTNPPQPAPATTTVTKTTTSNLPVLDLGAGRLFGELGRPMAAVIRTTAIFLGSSDETYAFTLQDSPDNSTWTNRGTLAVTAVGIAAVPAQIINRYVRLQVAIAGTTPSITFEAYLNPNVRIG